jgi:hypothetical protein
MAEPLNQVTLFSNGIGHFRRHYKVSGETKLSIPFHTHLIGDALASLQIFGNVKSNSPPSFTPANATSTKLSIDQRNALLSLLQGLSGSKVHLQSVNTGSGVTKSGDYTLVGVDTRKEHTASGVVERHYAVLLDSSGAIGFYSPETLSSSSIQFVDETVRSEIDKALKNNFQRIKPDSTFLDIVLESSKQEDVMIQYSIPVAAWKMCYAIRQSGDKFTLFGSVVVDNNTDEDWNDFIISVVTGDPISFSTDIADVVIPARKHVNLVESSALGNVYVEQGYSNVGTMRNNSKGGGSVMAMAMPCSASRSRSLYRNSTVGDGGLEYSESDYESVDMAESPGVESKEIGDFCIFTSKVPASIPSHKSALVQMFSANLNAAGVVLLYKESSHARRPFRAVKFKNETDFSLGKGKAIIYQDDLLSGEAVLDATKSGDNRMLPHCLENGVRIYREFKGTETKQNSISISKGVAIEEKISIASNEYVIENRKDEKFTVLIEHKNTLSNPIASVEGVVLIDSEKLSDGYRYSFKIAPKEKLTLQVLETESISSKIKLGDDVSWLKQNVVRPHYANKDNAIIKACLALQESIDELAEKISDVACRRRSQEELKARVRKDLDSVRNNGGGSPDPVVQNWIADLNKAETEIRSIDNNEAPDLQKKLAEFRKQLKDKLKELVFEWKAK